MLHSLGRVQGLLHLAFLRVLLVRPAGLHLTDSIDIVIDTGAVQMVLSQGTAENVDVETITTTISAGVGDVGVRGLDLGRVDLLEIGSLVVRNVPALIKNPPLSDLPRRRVLDSISPIALGLSTVIDYKNHQILLADTLPDEPSDIDIPMRVNRLAVIRGLINEQHPRTFVVDTGGEVISLSIGTTHTVSYTHLTLPTKA